METINLINISYNNLKKLSLVKNGDIGISSKVYRLDKDKCIKIFNESKNEFDMHRYNRFTNLDFECAVLPRELVLLRKKFRGYTMDFVNGNTLYNLDTNIEYSKFLMLAKKLIEESKEITEEGIILFDAHTDNIMYDKNKKKLVLTDPDEWAFSSTLKAKEFNFTILNASICEYMFGTQDFVFNDDIPIFAKISEEDDFIDYYETLRDNMSRERSIKIKTISDSRKII